MEDLRIHLGDAELGDLVLPASRPVIFRAYAAL